MNYQTHAAFALLIGLEFARGSSVAKLIFLGIVLVTSLLPDIDHPKSKAGKYVKPISFLFRHRGFFHTPIFLAILLFVIDALYPPAFIPVFIGYGSHMALDMITQKGIMPFHPISSYRLKGFVRTGTWVETLIFWALVAVIVLKAI
ncbi:MAG: metal-dependent hydrolase [archaeon]